MSLMNQIKHYEEQIFPWKSSQVVIIGRLSQLTDAIIVDHKIKLVKFDLTVNHVAFCYFNFQGQNIISIFLRF